MKNVIQAIDGLIWSVSQLQKLIPDGPSWDNKAQAIAEHKAFAQQELDFLNCQKYPYKATFANGMSFIPTMIDFDNQMVWHQTGQGDGHGEWVNMDDVTLSPNPYYKKLSV